MLLDANLFFEESTSLMDQLGDGQFIQLLKVFLKFIKWTTIKLLHQKSDEHCSKS